jgi:hypothetical protein
MLVGFTIEVFLAVVHPLTHRTYISRRLVVKVVVAVWSLSLVYYTGFFLSFAGIVNNLCYPSYNYYVKPAISR